MAGGPSRDAVMAGFLDAVTVMACPPYNAWAGPVPAAFGPAFIDLGDRFGGVIFSGVQGETPPAQ
jgi:hypothetical protein